MTGFGGRHGVQTQGLGAWAQTPTATGVTSGVVSAPAETVAMTLIVAAAASQRYMINTIFIGSLSSHICKALFNLLFFDPKIRS